MIPVVSKECHNVYHKGFEITFHESVPYYSCSLCFFSPVRSGTSASLNKIASGATVFIGETNLDIFAAEWAFGDRMVA